MRRLVLTISIVCALCASARAQTKISALPSGTPTTTDVVPYVADPAGTAATKKTTVSDLFGALTPFQLQSGNKHGDGAKFQLFTGSSSTNDCAKFDSNGNIVTNGGTCAAAAPVQSVFGRTGAVVAATNDYNFNQLAGSVSTSQQPSTTVNSVVNDTNVTGSISAQALTLNWSGALAKSRQHAATAYTDQANTFGAFAQVFQSGANFELRDPTDATKRARLDLSNITASNTRTVNVPDANSTTAQSQACTNQVFTAMSAQGVFTCALIPNAALSNSSVTLNAGSNFGVTAPGAMTLGSTYTIGSTSDNLRFANLGLGVAAPTGGGQIAVTAGANNLTLLTLKRNTDTSPTGNFADFQNAAGTSLWRIDITGSLAAGAVPAARVSGLATSATTDTTDAGNISTGTLDKNRVPGTLNATNAPSLTVSGTAGAGFAEFGAQSSNPSSPSGGFRLFADSAGKLSWRRASDGFIRSFDATLTADRTYTLPDRSATVATTTGSSSSGKCLEWDASGNVVTAASSAACGTASSAFMPTYARVTGSNATTTSATLVDVTGLSVALSANSVYEFVANITGNGADSNGVKFGVNYSAAGATVEAGIYADVAGTGTRTRRINALGSATLQSFFTSANDVAALIQGTITTGANAGNITIQHLKGTSGTSTIYIGSYLKVTKIQ